MSYISHESTLCLPGYTPWLTSMGTFCYGTRDGYLTNNYNGSHTSAESPLLHVSTPDCVSTL